MIRANTQMSLPVRPKHKKQIFDGPFCFFYSENNNECPIPLLKTRYEVNIRNNFAEIKTRQLYRNPFNQQLVIYYSFPTDPNFCLSRFNVYNQNILMQGVIKENQKTIIQYVESKEKGDTVLISSYSHNDKSTIRAKVGTLGPKQAVKIQYDMIGELKVEIIGQWTLIIPSNISPRYLNDLDILEDKIRTFFQVQSYYGDANDNHQVVKELKISLACSQPIIDWSSSCQLKAIPLSQRQFSFQFIGDHDHITENEFKFSYAYHFHELICTTGRQCILLSFNPIHKQSNFNKYEGQYIFLIDRSGSMSGNRIEQAKKALILFLKSLPVSSRYNVISFGSHFEKMHSQSKVYNDKSLQSTIYQIQSFEANFGGTEIAQPLLDIMAKNRKMMAKFERNIIILTDGHPQDIQKVIDVIRQIRQQKTANVHIMGVGCEISYDLIKRGALAGNGQHILIKKQEQISKSVIFLLERIASGKINKFQINTSDKFVQETQMPTELRKGKAHQICLSLKDHDQSRHLLKQNIDVKYYDEQENQNFSIRHCLSSSTHIEDLHKYMIHKQIQELSFLKQKGIRMDVARLSIRYQVISDETSFVCKIKGTQEQPQSEKGYSKNNIIKAKIFNIYIQAIDNINRKQPISVCLQMEVQQLKKLVEKLMEVPIDKIKLTYMKSQLTQDKKTLSYYKIFPESTVRLSVKQSRGTGFWVELYQDKQVYISCAKQSHKTVNEVYHQIIKSYPKLQGINYDLIYNRKAMEPNKLISEYPIKFESQSQKVYTNPPRYLFSYLEIVKLMRVNGYWQYDQKIVKNLKLESSIQFQLDLLKESNENINYNKIMTQVLIKCLKKDYPQAAEELKLIYQKVQHFLSI